MEDDVAWLTAPASTRGRRLGGARVGNCRGSINDSASLPKNTSIHTHALAALRYAQIDRKGELRLIERGNGQDEGGVVMGWGRSDLADGDRVGAKAIYGIYGIYGVGPIGPC